MLFGSLQQLHIGLINETCSLVKFSISSLFVDPWMEGFKLCTWVLNKIDKQMGRIGLRQNSIASKFYHLFRGTFEQ